MAAVGFALAAAFLFGWSAAVNAQLVGLSAAVTNRVVGNVGPQAAIAAEPPQAPLAEIERGREMFARQWTPADSHTPAGDGLGPMFNARSCKDCHNLGAVGGGGDATHNVELLTIIPPANKDRLDRGQFAERVAAIHPGFTTNPARGATVRPSITLHKFGINPAYGEFRSELLTMVTSSPLTDTPGSDGDSPAKLSHAKRPARLTVAVINASAPLLPPPTRIELRVVARNTPALFGVARIDSIPDDALQQAAKEQAKRRNGIKGQVALASDGKVGKFGCAARLPRSNSS